MDGILSGLTSIVPSMPDQTTITDRSGVKGPPVEIMPLPSNSFMSDDAAAELLNNPFTLSLDIKGYDGGAAGGGKVADRAAPPAGQPAADDSEAMLTSAYTLSLGHEENTPAAVEIALEMTRMKNYELLGKTAARQIYRRNREPAAGNDSVPLQDNDTEALIGEKVRSLLSQSAAQQNEAVARLTQDMLPAAPEPPPESNDAPTPPAVGRPLSASGVRQSIALLASLAGLQLSPSDIEAIMTLEPDLQDAMLNMLGHVNDDISGRPAADLREGLPGAVAAEPGAGRAHEQSGMGIPLGQDAGFVPPQTEPQQAILRQALSRILRQYGPAAAKPLTDSNDIDRAALFTDEELNRLAADVLAAGKAANAPVAVLRGSIGNLQKITELPYSLYVFGNVTSGRREDDEEEDETADQGERETGRMGPSEFLRLSEAVRMASVLHNLYYGGSGRFPRETPWYAPYVRYAVKNGIIRDGEFKDFNNYATRAETAYLFAGCVPAAELPVINHIYDIPDVSETIGYGGSIYTLFRAGVLTRSDKKEEFHPDDLITKAEAAAFIGRIATPYDRKHVV